MIKLDNLLQIFVLITLSNVYSGELIGGAGLDINQETKNESILEKPLQTSIVSELYNVPENCSQREVSKVQPVHTDASRMKKCCPFGEALDLDNVAADQNICFSALVPFEPKIVTARLYDNCIEDDELEIELPIEVTNPCNSSYLYKNGEDIFYVMQDGALLIMDEYANNTYKIESSYCIDVDLSGNMWAFVCISSITDYVQRNQIIFSASIMIFSIPFLIITLYLHVAVGELRHLNGCILCSMSVSLALGYTLLAVTNIFNLKSILLGYIIQFFLLAYFCIYFCLCVNMALSVWIPLKTRCFQFSLYLIYINVSILVSLVLVVLTAKKGYPGTPSYFLQGFTISIRESQQYFIPPISVLVFGSFLVMVITFFGFKRKRDALKNEMDEDNSPNGNITYLHFQEMQRQATWITVLGIIITALWLMELATFYAQEKSLTLFCMDIMNCLQGMFLFGVLLMHPKYRCLISRWWFDHGSYRTEKLELIDNGGTAQ